MMETTLETRSGWCVIKVLGRADSETADQLETGLRSAVMQHPKVAVDLAGLTYISSAGLRSLLQAARAAQERSVEFLVCAAGASVRKVFEMSGMHHILKFKRSCQTRPNAHPCRAFRNIAIMPACPFFSAQAAGVPRARHPLLPGPRRDRGRDAPAPHDPSGRPIRAACSAAGHPANPGERRCRAPLSRGHLLFHGYVIAHCHNLVGMVNRIDVVESGDQPAPESSGSR
jgi:anti-sigma B factor antagonist